MWSESFTGQRGIVPDCYQRIGLLAYATDFLDRWDSHYNSFIKLNSILHVSLKINNSTYNGNITELLQSLAKIKEELSVSNSKSFLFTIIYEGTFNYDAFQLFGESDAISCFAISCEGSRESVVFNLVNTKKLLPHVKIGLCVSDCIFFEWIVNRAVSVLDFIYIGHCTVPDIKMRLVDFAHSKQCNVIVSFTPEVEMACCNVDFLQTLSKKYEKQPSIVLAKSLIQMGFIVILDSMCAESSSAYLLSHPFTHRHTASAPAKIKSFMVEDVDVLVLMAISEQIESSFDSAFHTSVCSPPINRLLSNFVKSNDTPRNSNKVAENVCQQSEQLQHQPLQHSTVVDMPLDIGIL